MADPVGRETTPTREDGGMDKIPAEATHVWSRVTFTTEAPDA